MNKRIVKVSTTELYEDEALRIYNEGKYIVNYSGVWQLHYSTVQKRVYGTKIIDQKGISLRGRYHVMDAKTINDILGKKILLEV